MELEKNEAGLSIMPRQLDWDYHFDDWEIRAARSWRLCVEEPMRHKCIIPSGGAYLREMWAGSYMRSGNDLGGNQLFNHPLCSPWKDQMFKGISYYKDYFANEEDKAGLDKLPDKIKVYRGYNDCPYGFSWTLSKKIAEMFGSNIREREVEKKDVFAYLNDRTEEEIIILDGWKEWINYWWGEEED